jgi:hypothetical protein
MITSELRFPAGYDAAHERGEIRWQLFLHRDVRDVLLTERPDTLQVLHEGAPDLPGWTASLAEEGYPAPELLPEPVATAAHTGRA